MSNTNVDVCMRYIKLRADYSHSIEFYRIRVNYFLKILKL